MKHILTRQSLTELMSAQQPPCLSLYQPTQRHHPDNQQDRIRYRNLLKELERLVRQQHPAADTRGLLVPLEALAEDAEFWRHTLDGLAVLRSQSLFRVFRLQRTVAELAVVTDSFHTVPLRRLLQSADRYQVLGLSLDSIQLFEGDRDTLDEIEPAPEVPRSISAALGSELTEPHHTVSSYGGVGSGHRPMHHGQGGKKDEADNDTERFFRAIDRAVLEHHSRPTGLPLILAALPEHHARFRKISHNPFLVDACVSIHPSAVSSRELRAHAWQAIEPQYKARQNELADQFERAKSHQLGSDDLVQVAQAAAAGRVATLLIEADRHIAGRLDSATGKIERADFDHPQVDDLLEDLAALVEHMGGQVVVMPTQQIPGKSGLAATFRH